MINNTGFKDQTELKPKAFKIDAKGSTWGLSQPRLVEVWGSRRGPQTPLASLSAALLGVESWMSSPNR